MSSLHSDRLLDEGTAPPTGTANPRRTGRPTPYRRRPKAEQQEAPQQANAPDLVPAPRPGDAQPAGETPTTTTDVPAPEPVTIVGPAPDATSGQVLPAASSAPAADGPVERLAEVTDLAGLSGVAEATALAGVKGLAEPGATAGGSGAPETAAPRVRRPVLRRLAPASVPRRPMVYLAAALTGALGLGLLSGAEPVARADAAEPVSESVSVAEELGLDVVEQAAVTEADAAARLGEMTASRTAREAEQAAAAAAQAEADRLAAEAAAAAAAEAARPHAVLPVPGARLTSGFGQRWGTLHGGIDLAAPMRTPEYAVLDGVVLEAGPASGFGLAVYIQHENGDVTVYGHMDEILVTAGQVVRAGDTIALLGNRGQSTGPHLHFEVHVGGLNGQRVDPLPWLRGHGLAI